MHGQVLATFVGLQSAEVLPEHDVSLTVMGMLGRRVRKWRREGEGWEDGEGEGEGRGR